MKKFYDVHCHLLDLSHPGFLAFISGDGIVSRNSVRQVFKQVPWYAKVLPIWVGSIFPGVISRRLKTMLADTQQFLHFKNLVSFMDNTIENQLLILDYYLRKEPRIVNDDNTFQIGNEEFNKIVLCPLVIDFGYKDTNNPNIFYNKPSDKPVSHQVDDLFRSIRKYYTHKLILHTEKEERLKCVCDDTLKENKLFEIYPFLGINTKNYDLSELKILFEKYFNGYEQDTPELRAQKLFDMLDKYPASVSQERADFTYLFAGIKVYPPLGFDPWPEDEKELEKVRFLYEKCIEKNIPITTHCSDEGFKIDPKSQLFTSPATKWTEVLEHYNHLKLNFAHLGYQYSGKSDWQSAVLDLMNKYENVYTDISFHAIKPNYYQNFSVLLKSLTPKQLSKVMYGSDFMMVLSKVESFNHYMEAFKKSTLENKIDLCSTNSPRFLFG